MKLSNDPEIQHKIDNEEDFIFSKKNNNSLKKFLKKNPDGAPNSMIGFFLNRLPTDVEAIYQSAVKKYRQLLGVDVE